MNEENAIPTEDTYSPKQRQTHSAFAKEIWTILRPVLEQNHLGAWYEQLDINGREIQSQEDLALRRFPSLLLQALPHDSLLTNKIYHHIWEKGMDVPFFSLYPDYSNIRLLKEYSLQGKYPRYFTGKNNHLYQTDILYLFNAQGQAAKVYNIHDSSDNKAFESMVLHSLSSEFPTEEQLSKIPRLDDFDAEGKTVVTIIEELEPGDIELVKTFLQYIKDGDVQFLMLWDSFN